MDVRRNNDEPQYDNKKSFEMKKYLTSWREDIMETERKISEYVTEIDKKAHVDSISRMAEHAILLWMYDITVRLIVT